MNETLKQELELLVAFLWKVKKLSFSKAAFSPGGLLEKEGIIKLNGNNYTVAGYKKLAPTFLEHYKNVGAFEYSSDFSQTVTFIKKLEGDFLSEGSVQQFNYLNKEIWKAVVVAANKQLHNDFNAYLNVLNKDDDYEEIFDFIDAYNEIISELNINAESLYKNAMYLKELTKTHNMPLVSIILGLKKKSESDENVGVKLLQIALQSETRDHDIISAIVAGLYNKLGNSFYQQQLVPLLGSKEFKAPVINGLANIDRIETVETDLFIELFDKEKQEGPTVLVVTKLLFSVLKAKNDFPDREKYIPDIFSRLNEIVLLGNEQLASFILNEVAFLYKYDTDAITIIETIIHQPYFSIKKYAKSIEQTFWHLKDVGLLKKTLIAIAEKCPFEKLTDFWSLTNNGFDKKIYGEMLIEFISNNKASIRFIGIDLFNQCSFYTGYKFDKNILDLPPMVQYKLWVGLTQDYKEPKYLLPALAPLLYSGSEIVKEAFVSKLEEYSENYGRQIIKVLEQHIDQSRTEHLAIIERIENYVQDYYAKNILLKKEIQELNPFYTHNKLFNTFNRLHPKTFTTKFKKSTEENSSFIQTARNIQLAKGGGWKINPKKEVSKLQRFESGFSLPRDYFIFPNHYEMVESEKMRRDWTEEEFTLIKEGIDNEQQ